MEIPETVEDLADILLDQNYLADRGLATATYLALCLGRPLLLEGEAGVGKTELAKAIASAFGLQLIRLQCYEGIDANQALYEWDYTRQLLYVRTLTEQALQDKTAIDDIFGPRFLVERPLLKAIKAGDRAVLLVDEIDRADDEFEAFLLEVLSDFQVTIPELGTVKCKRPPVVVLTSNRTRELHDALKRRCLFHWIDYPKLEREVEIVRARAPEVPEELARQVSKAVQNLRKMDLQKRPGVAETLDWARALDFLGAETEFEVLTQPEAGQEKQFDAPSGLMGSNMEVLRHKRFAEMTDEEKAALRKLMQKFKFLPPKRRTRRTVSARDGIRPDLRKTIRAAMRRHGEVVDQHWRERRVRRRKVILILDISGSMADYSRALMHFGYAAARAAVGTTASAKLVEVFCFGTRLTRITPEMQRRDPDQAFDAAAKAVFDWEGGTRIGESLDNFVRH